MLTFARARRHAGALIGGASLVFAANGCGARTGFDVESIAGASDGEAQALDDAGTELDDAGSERSPGATSPRPCSSQTTMASCVAAGCSLCAGSPGWICLDTNEGALFADEAGRELGACGDLNGNVVTGPLHRP